MTRRLADHPRSPLRGRAIFGAPICVRSLLETQLGVGIPGQIGNANILTTVVSPYGNCTLEATCEGEVSLPSLTGRLRHLAVGHLGRTGP
jgi:hypothetical protein